MSATRRTQGKRTGSRATEARIYFVTGTDTGVGKTVLTGLLARHLREEGRQVMAVKPLVSGGRADARVLRTALGDAVDLDAINPWWYRPGLTPLVAARRAGEPVKFAEVRRFLKQSARGREVLLVEGAGGLLSPLGEDFDARDLIRDLGATPVVVAANRLGVLNGVLLTLEVLRGLGGTAARSKVALMGPPRETVVSRSNAAVLRERLGEDRLVEIPWLDRPGSLPAGAGWRDRLARLLRG